MIHKRPWRARLILVCRSGLLAIALVLFSGTGRPIVKKRPVPKRAFAAVRSGPPVEIQARLEHDPSTGVYSYVYTVSNGSAFPIAEVWLGFDGYRQGPEIAIPPLHFTDDSGMPAGSVASPPGWAFRYMQAPEDSLGFLAWEGTDIPPNVSLTGFRIAVSEPDNSYDRSHWKVFLHSSAEAYYMGDLKPYYVSAAESSDPVDRLGSIGVSPRPTAGSATFSFELPRSEKVSVDIFDMQGRLVRHLQETMLMRGKNTVRWDGKLAIGREVGSGVYFVRLKYGSTQRFGRIVVAR